MCLGIPGEVRDSGYARMQLEQIDIARRMIARGGGEVVNVLDVGDDWVVAMPGAVGDAAGEVDAFEQLMNRGSHRIYRIAAPLLPLLLS